MVKKKYTKKRLYKQRGGNFSNNQLKRFRKILAKLGGWKKWFNNEEIDNIIEKFIPISDKIMLYDFKQFLNDISNSDCDLTHTAYKQTTIQLFDNMINMYTDIDQYLKNAIRIYTNREPKINWANNPDILRYNFYDNYYISRAIDIYFRLNCGNDYYFCPYNLSRSYIGEEMFEQMPDNYKPFVREFIFRVSGSDSDIYKPSYDNDRFFRDMLVNPHLFFLWRTKMPIDTWLILMYEENCCVDTINKLANMLEPDTINSPFLKKLKDTHNIEGLKVIPEIAKSRNLPPDIQNKISTYHIDLPLSQSIEYMNSVDLSNVKRGNSGGKKTRRRRKY